MRRLLVLFLLTACASGPPNTPASLAALETPPPPPKPLDRPPSKCSEWLDEALFEPIEGARDGVLEARIERCEKALLSEAQALRVAKTPGGLLEALARDELRDIDRDEAGAYLGLVSRYALARGVRRLYYFGLRLRPAFEAVAKRKSPTLCDPTRREQALFLLLAPKAMGGQEDFGQALLQSSLGQPRCPLDQFVLVDALLLRGEIKRAEKAFATFNSAKVPSTEAAVFERVRTTLSDRLQKSRRRDQALDLVSLGK